MNPITRRRWAATAASAAALAAIGQAQAQAQAQTFPSKPIKLIVGFAPGGAVDIIARAVAQQITGTLGQTVVVENKPGAGTNIAMRQLIDSPADGHTLMLTANSIAANPALYQPPPFDPGKDVTLAFDNNDTGTVTSNLIPASYFNLPEYKRSYQALEFFGQLRGDNFNLNASYTLSKTEGNVEGYVNSGLGQVDAGLTQDFDNFLFENGADGPLPNDRTHVIKMFGNYNFTDEFSVGGNVLIMSGRPISCLGFVDLQDPRLTPEDRGQLAAYSGSSFYCADENNVQTLRNRGDFGRTDWTYTVDMQLGYRPARFGGNIGFYLDIQNLLDTHDVLAVNERSQKGSSSSPEYNPDFLQPTGFQSPRRITLTARYNF